jgi:hypothetical protein
MSTELEIQMPSFALEMVSVGAALAVPRHCGLQQLDQNDPAQEQRCLGAAMAAANGLLPIAEFGLMQATSNAKPPGA